MCWVLVVNEIQLAATAIGQTRIGGFQHSNTVFALNGFTAITETQYAIKAYLLHPLETCETGEEHIHSVNLSHSVCTASWANCSEENSSATEKCIFHHSKLPTNAITRTGSNETSNWYWLHTGLYICYQSVVHLCPVYGPREQFLCAGFTHRTTALENGTLRVHITWHRIFYLIFCSEII